MTIDISSIRYRLDLILSYLEELSPLRALSLSEFLDDIYKIRAAERLLEITLQAILDINNHILKAHFQISKKSNDDGFQELAQRDVIADALAQSLLKSGGFRNRLAHHYDTISPELIFQFIPEALAQFPDYVEQISDFLDLIEGTNE
jgi:uncharacterized protein YutE (UPF0331/DUF86 family)